MAVQVSQAAIPNRRKREGESAMRCRSCDAELPEGATFCPKCGTRQAAGETFETIDRMIEDYRRKLEQKPDDADARFNLALAYKKKRLDDLAIGELERLRTQVSDFADLEYELAALYLRQKHCDRALDAAQRALTIDPHHHAAKHLLQRITREKG
jgi:tetratricopeptide (TPR) repeat protein